MAEEKSEYTCEKSGPSQPHCWHVETDDGMTLRELCCWCGFIRTTEQHGEYRQGYDRSRKLPST